MNVLLFYSTTSSEISEYGCEEVQSLVISGTLILDVRLTQLADEIERKEAFPYTPQTVPWPFKCS
jgi:hypothetical protein